MSNSKILVEMSSREGQQEIADAIREITRGVLDIERAEAAAENAENYAAGASASAQNADAIATQLTDYLETKETLTAPAIDPTLTIGGAGADAKVTGNVAKGLYEHSVYDILSNAKRINDSVFTWLGDGSCTVVCSDNAHHQNTMLSSNEPLPINIKPGKTYFVKHSSSKVRLEIWKKVNENLERVVSLLGNYIVTIPADAERVLIRLAVYADAGTVNETVKPEMYSVESEIMRGALCSIGGHNDIEGALGYTDANDIDRNCIIACFENSFLNNVPYEIGWLQTIIQGANKTKFRFQLMYPMFPYNKVMYRACRLDTTWDDWKTMEGIQLLGDSYGKIDSCDDVTENSIYFASTDGEGVPRLPDFPNGIGWLQTLFSDSKRWAFQLAYPWLSDSNIYYRIKNGSGGTGWTPWKTIGSGQTINNTFVTNHYTNTYNVTATPTITTDTNNYLASTGDTTDRTADIEAMLNSTGVCHLGTGDFYVSGVDVPDNGTLDGCGNSTKIHLLNSVADGYTVKLNSNSTLKDVMLVGADTDITLSATVGTRHGVLWEGNANGDNDSIPYRGTISNVFIKGFNGGGITCYNTGYGTSGLNVSDCHITNCNAAINISYWSEFHRFTNINATYNYYGCINNGGNNVFVNCNFSSNKMGMLMDNSQGQSPNNAHGSAIGCVFNHSDSNNGIGIKILNCDNGFVFNGCQIFFSQIYLEDTSGIVVSNSDFGFNNCNITINNGGAVLFNGNMHSGQPAISITNNANVHFVNCYVRSTGAEVTPAIS